MDIKERLAHSQAKMNDMQQRLNAIEQEKQELLQEILRLDGECRLLNELSKESENGS